MHAMETNLGAGAGQAIEDAYILARLLTHSSTTRSTIDCALEAYNQSRLTFTMDVVRETHRAGKLFEFHGGPTPFLPRDRAWQKKWGEEATRLWDFQLRVDGAEECWHLAEQCLLALTTPVENKGKMY